MMYELLSALSLAAIAAFLFVPYDTYRVEKVRQSLFALRDELFDEARAGKISFDSRAYVATRALLNGLIRFSHRVSLPQLLAYRILITDVAAVGASDGPLQRAMNASPTADRELCGRYIMRANVMILEHVLTSPLVLMTVIPPLLGVILSRAGYQIAGRIVQSCRAQFADLDSIAFREGQA